MDPQNQLLRDALMEKMKELSKEEVGVLNERIDQLENNRNNSGDEEGRRRGRHEGGRLEGIKVKVPQFVGRNDLEAYLEWETKIEQICSCYNYSDLQNVQVSSIEFTNYALIWWTKWSRRG